MDYLHNPIIVGKVGAPYGVKGWSHLISFTDPIENILTYRPWWVNMQNQWQLLEKIDVQQDKTGRLFLHLPECVDRTAAARYTNALIAVERQQLPKTAPHEYYWADLEGLTVLNQQSVVLGVVDHLIETGAHDVMVVKGERVTLIPYRFGVTIIEVDLSKRQILVDWNPEY